jgi:alpha-tubulin suppressor-like RCC1 family protein
VPAFGAAAALLTITVANPGASGFLTVWPEGDLGSAVPNSSVMNFTAGQNVSSQIVVQLPSSGYIDLFNGSTGYADYVIDVVGYFAAGDPNGEVPQVNGSGQFFAPTRIVDTRIPLGGHPRLQPHATELFKATPGLAVPANGIAAVVVNVVAVQPDSVGFLTLFAEKLPGSSNVNLVPGADVANEAIVPVNPDGSFAVFNGSAGGTDVVVDLVGFILAGPQATVYRTGMVLSWGYPHFGTLGDGSPADCWNHCNEMGDPRPVAGLTDVVSMAGNGASEYALKADGTVWAWGENSEGQLGTGTVPNQSASGVDETISDVPVQVVGLTDVVSIAASDFAAYAIKRDGTLWAWGHNAPPLDLLGTSQDVRNSPVPIRVPGMNNVVQVSTGTTSTVFVLKADGTVWGWGLGWSWQLGTNSLESSNIPTQLPNLSGIKKIAIGAYRLALKDDGTLWSWGEGWYVPGTDGWFHAPTAVQIPAPKGIVDIQANTLTAAYALMADGRILAWGANPGGQLGDSPNGPGVGRNTMDPVPGITTAVQVSAGATTTYAALADGTALAWGSNVNGVMGVGNVDVGSGPAVPRLPVPIKAINGGWTNGYAIVR